MADGDFVGGSAPKGFGVGMFGSAFDFALNNAANDIAMNRQLRNSKEMFDYTFLKQNKRQDLLNLNMASIMKQSLRNAGLSAASLGTPQMSSSISGGSGISGSALAAQSNMFSNFLQLKNLEIAEKATEADVALKASQTAQNEANTAEIRANAQAMRDNLQAETAYKTAMTSNADASTKHILADIDNEAQRLKNETNIANTSIEQMQANIANLGVQTDINLKQLAWTDRLLAAQVLDMRSRGNLNNAQAQKALSDIEVNNENMKLIQQNCMLTDQQTEQLKAYTSLLKENVTREQFNNDIRAIIGRDAYIKLEKDKMLEPMYNNAIAFQTLKNMETHRKAESVNASVGAVTSFIPLLNKAK